MALPILSNVVENFLNVRTKIYKKIGVEIFVKGTGNLVKSI